MTKTEKKLHGGAELHLAGSGELLVTIYRCAKDLRMAATINCFLLGDERDRMSTLQDMRGQVGRQRPRRSGPKLDRFIAADKAIDALCLLVSP